MPTLNGWIVLDSRARLSRDFEEGAVVGRFWDSSCWSEKVSVLHRMLSNYARYTCLSSCLGVRISTSACSVGLLFDGFYLQRVDGVLLCPLATLRPLGKTGPSPTTRLGGRYRSGLQQCLIGEFQFRQPWRPITSGTALTQPSKLSTRSWKQSHRSVVAGMEDRRALGNSSSCADGNFTQTFCESGRRSCTCPSLLEAENIRSVGEITRSASRL